MQDSQGRFGGTSPSFTDTPKPPRRYDLSQESNADFPGIQTEFFADMLIKYLTIKTGGF
jgi:hypothetical protein